MTENQPDANDEARQLVRRMFGRDEADQTQTDDTTKENDQ